MDTRLRERLVPRVNLRLDVRSATDGRLLARHETHNLVTTAGRNLIRDLLHWASAADDPRPSGLTYFAVGTGSTAPAAGDVQLGAEVARDVFTQRTKATGQLEIKFYLASTQANGSTLREAGLFGNGATAAANSGSLYARALHDAIAKTSAIAITYTWTLTWTDDGV